MSENQQLLVHKEHMNHMSEDNLDLSDGDESPELLARKLGVEQTAAVAEHSSESELVSDAAEFETSLSWRRVDPSLVKQNESDAATSTAETTDGPDIQGHDDEHKSTEKSEYTEKKMNSPKKRGQRAIRRPPDAAYLGRDPIDVSNIVSSFTTLFSAAPSADQSSETDQSEQILGVKTTCPVSSDDEKQNSVNSSTSSNVSPQRARSHRKERRERREKRARLRQKKLEEIARSNVVMIETSTSIPVDSSSSCIRPKKKDIPLLLVPPEYQPPELLLAVQRGKCAGCGSLQASALGLRYCHYSGSLYCISCHHEDMFVTPGYLLRQFDATERPVCRAAYEYLCSIYSTPFLHLSVIYPPIYQHPQLNLARRVRDRLSLIRPFVETCPSRRKLLSFLGSRAYMLNDRLDSAWCDQYSMEDLVLFFTKDLAARLAKVADSLAQHIVSTECLSCFGRHRTCASTCCGARVRNPPL